MDVNTIVATILYYTKNLVTLFYEKVIITIAIGIIGYVTLVYKAQEIATLSLFVLMIIDFVLGFGNAVKKKEVSSFRLKIGIGKFILYTLVIVAGYGADMMLFKQTVEFGLHYFFIVYLGVTELISIAEHVKSMGINLPIIGDLKKLRKELEDETFADMIKKIFKK